MRVVYKPSGFDILQENATPLIEVTFSHEVLANPKTMFALKDAVLAVLQGDVKPVLTARQEFIRLAKRAKQIVNSEASWEIKYHTVFSDEISKAIENTGIEVKYYDPDTTYKEDVCAYVDALCAKAADLQLIEDAISE